MLDENILFYHLMLKLKMFVILFFIKDRKCVATIETCFQIIYQYDEEFVYRVLVQYI